MLEKTITTAIIRYLCSLPHCFCWKQHGGQFGTAGIPDIIVCLDGRFVAFEVKTESGKLTKLQESALRKITAANGRAYTVTSLNQVKQIIENMGGGL